MEHVKTEKTAITNPAGVTSERILTVIFLASVFILSITKIENTDTWTHLSFGRWIWEHRTIPTHEPFISTDKPFPYNNWLFGFILYLAYHLFGFPGVILFKATTITAAFFFLLRDSLRPYRNSVVASLIMTAVVIMVRHRFVERPDIFLMLFLGFSIYSLNAFLYEKKKCLYLLPLVHMLWANSHTSLPLMAIPFLSFLGGGIIQRCLGKKGMGFPNTPSPEQLKTILLVFLASLAASLISPYFIDQYILGMQALSMAWWKQEIVELRPPTAWHFLGGLSVMTVAVVMSFFLSRRRISLMHLFLVLPFMALSYSAIRFIFLFGIIAGPVLSRNISAWIEEKTWSVFFSKKGIIAVAACWIIAYVPLTVTKVVGYIDPEENKSFGFGVNYFAIPEGALNYMDRQGIFGRVFNLFQWGGYITWRDFPKRIPFIDGRGFTDSDLLEKLMAARRKRVVLDELQSKYGFESVLVEYLIASEAVKEASSETDIALSHPGWALVYWDDKSLLYLRRGGKYDSVIQRDEYRYLKPANGFAGVRARLHDKEYRDNLIQELLRNIRETDAFLPRLFLGDVYNEIGLYRDALMTYQEALEKPRGKDADARASVYKGIASAFFNLGNLNESIRYYEKALSLHEDADIRYQIGVIYEGTGEKEKALRNLEKAVSLNGTLISAYPDLVRIYRELGMARELRKATEAYEAVRVRLQGEEHFQRGLTAYLKGQPDLAIEEFQKSLEVYPANPAAYSNIGYIYFDANLLEKAYEFQKRATEIDLNYANAHYGLALIYRKWGDLMSAKREWEAYLRIEPVGYYSRKAEEEIRAIEKGKQ